MDEQKAPSGSGCGPQKLGLNSRLNFLQPIFVMESAKDVFGGAHFCGAAFGVGRRKTPTHTVGEDRPWPECPDFRCKQGSPMKVREGLTKPSEP